MIKQPLQNLIDEAKFVTGYSESVLELVFQLPPKYLQKAVTKKVEPVGLRQLLKLIIVYPFLVKVADMNYDEKEAKRILAHIGVDLLMDQNHVK